MLDIKTVKKNLLERQKTQQELATLKAMLFIDFIAKDEEITIKAEIDRLTDYLSTFSLNTLKLIDLDFINELDLLSVKHNDLKNVQLKYLFPNLIVKNEITLIAAKPSGGKSLTTVALSNMALLNQSITFVFYFDLDNSPTTLKKRGIDRLESKWCQSFQYFSMLRKKNGKVIKKDDIFEIIYKLKQRNLEHALIVFDSAKNFLQDGADRDKNKDVSKIMELFKLLRNNGATVILLHHTNKPSKDLEELTYAGSSAWVEDSSNAFLLKRNDYKNTFVFEIVKPRVGELIETGFTYDEEAHYLHQVDLLWAKETREDEQIREEIISFLKNLDQKPTYSQIMKRVEEEGFAKDKINFIIQHGKGKLWKATKLLTQNNRDVFELIQEKNPNLAQISQIESLLLDKSAIKARNE